MSTDGFIFSQDGKTLTKCEFAKLGTVISVPQGVSKIGNGVFAEAPVTKVILPDSVTEIGQNLFSSCESLEEVKLPSNLTSLKPFTFAGCSSLRKITMPDNITSFPEGLFWGCMSLEEVPFRNGMDALEPDVLRDCEAITSLQIPPSVKTIKTGALSGCSNLTTIVFPAGLESIQDRSLAGLKALQYMRFSGDCDNFFVDENGGCLYQLTENGTVLIKCPVNVESVYLVENTCDVHIDAFECCNSLAEVYASENAPEALVNKLLELCPSIDINSYGDEPTEEEEFSSKIENLGDDLDKVQVNEKEFSEIGEFTQDDSDEDEETDSSVQDILNQNNISSDEVDSEGEIAINQSELESILSQHNVVEPEPETENENASESEMTEDERIQEILNSQVCRNDSLDEGFRPISMDELENLMNGPVVDPMDQIREREAQEAAAQNSTNENQEPVLDNDTVNDTEENQQSEDERIQEILNSQCCRNDSLDEGFRPISMDELENALNGPVADSYIDEDFTEEDKKAGEDFIQSIVNDQVCRDDSLDEGFRPVSTEELEYLMKDHPDEEPAVTEEKAEPISENTETTVSENTEEKPKRKRASRKSKKSEEVSENESTVSSTETEEEKPKRKRASRKSKKTEESSENTETTVAESTEEKPKRKRASRKSKKTEETVESTAETASDETIEVPVINDNTEEETVAVAAEKTQIVENSEEPRFIRAMKNLASHQMVVEDNGNKIDNVYGDLKELLVIADGVAPSTNDFSSHLVKFSKAVAKKYGFTKIYFFEDLPLDNPEFIYGLESFGNFRNVLYACNKPDAENISENQKELINAAGITLPASSKIHSVKEKLSDVEMQYPVKILVQDNYIEGLLYCAEKYREKNGIK
ncbi:MAG: leucine-rich repeat protein [Treponema sp.]|uniref:leucine-rich repeat protein n=1 Tax=Treponema sp. TaxID=166 RepID=UPI00298D8AC9|nr:leucine-rich repeat protein [Treponema sp.]MCQ2601943.1 leucine-rich repeat protein [Treponema sp.]